jgi:ABC-type transport system substrate-binding protein
MSHRRFLRICPAAPTLAGALLLLGGIVVVSELSAQDPPAEKRKRMEEEETDSKPSPKPAKPVREEEEEKARAAPGNGKRIEEEDDTPRTAKKIIQVDDDNSPAKPIARGAASAPFNLADAIRRRPNNQYLKALQKEIAFPHDLVFIRTSSSAREELVAPVAIYVGENGKANWPRGGIQLQLLDSEGHKGKTYNPLEGSVKEIRHFEQLTLTAVNDFLQGQKELPADSTARLPYEVQVAAAEAALTNAVNFHDSAKSRGIRKGDEWEQAIERPLRNRLLDIRLEQLKALAEEGKWETAFNLTVVLVGEYREPEQQRRIAKPLTELLQASLRGGVESEDGVRVALRRLHDLEDQFPDKDILKPITDGLKDHANRLYEAAKKDVEKNKFEDALVRISQAVELAPRDNRLREYQRDLMKQHRILRVGVRELPKYLSPALASTDNELRAVELLFESLVKPSFDAKGDERFVPALAVGQPEVELLGRKFHMPRGARWSDGTQLTSGDIRSSLRWYKDYVGTGLTPTWATLLDDVDVRHPYRVNLQMQQGYLDPYSLMSFKVLPQGKDPAAEEFAERKPISSGPYVYNGRLSEAGRTYASFVFNPFYGTRPGKEGLPRIREVRFFAYKAFVDGKGTEEFTRAPTDAPLDVMLDLTTEHAVAVAKNQGAAGVRVTRPNRETTANRRVYFLAVNNKVSPLNLPNVRRSLAHAINREKLLNDFFRPKVNPMVQGILGQLHVAINGPYPAKSWACDPKVGLPKIQGSLDLYDEPTARGFFRGDKGQGDIGIRAHAYELKYPDDDPALKPAMEALCQQLHDVLGFNVKPVGLERHKLRDDVESGNYELAYYHYDFRDETYSLEPLLAARAGAGGNNIFRSSQDKVDFLFQDLRSHRDFEMVKADAHKIHDEIYNNMPFIPLWQLDVLAALHNAIVVPPFDPVLVFTDIEAWTAKPRPTAP